MIQIGITMRVEIVIEYGERRDCLDQRWSDLINCAGMLPVPLANHFSVSEKLLENLNCAGFILSGGNDLAFLADAKDPAPERDRLEGLILGYAKKKRLPLLGICRGMQFMNHYLGGTIETVEGHVAVRHAIVIEPVLKILENYSDVNSYHTRGISKIGLADSLQAVVSAPDSTIEAFIHKTLPWVGIMWHPEREEPLKNNDLGLLKALFKERWLN